MTGGPKPSYKVGDFTKENIQAYNDRIDRFNQAGDPAQAERGRQFEAKVAPQFAAAQEREGRAANERESALQKRFRDEDAAAYAAREKARYDQTPEGRAQTNKMALEGVKGDVKRDVAETRAGSLQTVQEMKTAGQLEQEGIKQKGAGERTSQTNQTRRDITNQTETGKDTRQQVSEAGKDRRGTEREQGRNLRAADIMAERQAHRHFLESKATQDLLQREGSEQMKQFATTFRTKLQQGIKPDANEVENYNNLVDAVYQRQGRSAGDGGPGYTAGSGGAQPSVQGTPTNGGPPPAAIAALRSNPSLKAQFDSFYGAGSSDRALGAR